MTRAKILANSKLIVVKIGSRVITSSKNELDSSAIETLVKDIEELYRKKYQIVVVTSGAIVAGLADLKLGSRPTDLPLKQAASAVGQVKLMHSYATAFKKYNIPVAQILLTREDLQNRHRYLNARNTLLRLLEKGVVPIINENDTVAVEEIKFGDNDTLSALVALMMDADMLIILTDICGLYTDLPCDNKEAKLISHVDKVTPAIEKMAKCKGEGAGGMETKIHAAKMLTESGIPVIIADGREKQILNKLISCEEIGTFFAPAEQKKKSKKTWLAFSLKSKGQIVVDKGAKEALLKGGKSLLPSGILSVKGEFEAGDSVSITDENGKEFAKGLSNYSSEEIQKIKGLKSSEINKALGYKDYDEVIHRDNLVVL
ncbi:MAG: glutamate 5-kinase [Candidatus Ratteibacteria bacterium]|nr:glutamate 5-kinase [Candidatus Ratteibacteria bacterium]